ncbi:uncharacterized protein FOMMEDRAFT_26741 [Fomitiporia mediterranea MF3/22]|uniref:uncharacterized protein n=1 Tax=Fomitiporia mediterranea (strain MF3/22) TaxID=694068 RepID=UPI000440753B|nr:uncharacterized protein FOMMEDRAFT_26741 [Fomitiporia mediterranea MF3/22]EJD05951.1 hypothetical protein FOMMEDRAFT_26741 [Fomitiporia mediterranea MF3/22]
MTSRVCETFDEKKTLTPPPPVPLDRLYTANWCEENIYMLAKRFLEDESVRAVWSIYAIFISNRTRSVALWSQKLREDVVVWDYHVILALESHDDERRRPEVAFSGEPGPPRPSSTWIYDLDSRLEMPCKWEDYIASTFPYASIQAAEAGWSIPETYQSLFRIVAAEEFLESFASDRSHMLGPESESDDGPPRYHSPEPSYPCIVGTKAAARGISNNLMSSFVCMDMENTEVGSVYTLEQAKALFSQ